MRQVIKTIIFLVAAILFSGFTQAAPVEWNIDKAHSNFYFDIRHIFQPSGGALTALPARYSLTLKNLRRAALHLMLR